MERVQGFDVARGVATVLMVAFHLSFLPQNTIDWQQPISRMGLLMLISGAVAAPGLSRNRAYSRGRAIDLLWLVMVWTPLILLTDKGLAGLAAIPHELIAPSTPLWYMSVLALLVLSVPLLSRVHAVVPFSITAAAALCYLAGGRTGVIGYDRMMHFAVFFYVGLYGRDPLVAVLKRCGSRQGWAAAAGIVALTVLPVPHSVVAIPGTMMLLVAAQGASRSSMGGALTWLGRHTPDIYLAHAPLLIMIGRLVGPIGLGMFGLLTVGTIASCLALRAVADEIGLGWLYRRPRLADVDWLWVEGANRPARSRAV